MDLTDFFPEELVDEFLKVYLNKPYKHNKWGCRFMDSFFLYCYAKTINPETIVESGTYQGQTSWLFEQACPKAMIYSFDISHWKLKKKTKWVIYKKYDWAKAPPQTYGSMDGSDCNSMIFFDDHINQMQRLEEAKERGFKHLFFDDNYPLDKIDFTENVPLPTLSCYGIGKVLPTHGYLTYVKL